MHIWPVCPLVAQNGTARTGTDAGQGVKQGPLRPPETAPLSDGFEDISLDEGGARAADAKAGGNAETAGGSNQPPKTAQRVILFSGAPCRRTCPRSINIIERIIRHSCCFLS